MSLFHRKMLLVFKRISYYACCKFLLESKILFSTTIGVVCDLFATKSQRHKYNYLLNKSK